jgi:branched-chain amino acid transport system substrate-binding protein
LKAEDVVKIIKADIAANKVQSGDKLPSERDLQEVFQTSRGTVREALKILEGMGLLTIKKGRGGGAIVAPNASRIATENLASLFQVEESNILAFTEFRLVIEPKMAFQAALYRTQVELAKLRYNLEQYQSDPQTQELFVSVTKAFFEGVADSTQNDYIITFYQRQVIPALVETAKLIYEIPKCVELSIHFYNQIYEAIKTNDPKKSEIITEAYLVQIENCVKNAKNFGINLGARKSSIKWGIMLDLSGPTTDYAKQNAMGMIDAARYINETGGINGKKLELLVHDDKYQESEALAIYKQFRDQEKVLGIFIQATGNNLSLAPRAMRDGIFMFTGAPTNKLADPGRFPYYFCLGPTYTDMAKIVLKYIREAWTDSSRNPRLVFMFPDNPYGRDPLEAAKKYAAETNIDIGPDQIIKWPTVDATAQLKVIRKDEPDFVYIVSTAMNAAHILKDASRLKMNTQFIGNIRVINEDLPRLAMETAEGIIGIQPFAFYGADVPGMEPIVKIHDKWHPYHTATQVYIEGWAYIIVLSLALKLADQAGELNVEGLKQVLENFRDVDSGGLTPPVSYFEDDHRSTTQARIFKIQGSRFVAITNYIDVGRQPLS